MKTRHRSRSGASLIEIIVAVGVLGVGLYAIGSSLQAARSGAAVAIRKATAEAIASNVVEMLRADRTSLSKLLGRENSARLPREGWREWPSQPGWRWSAQVDRMNDATSSVLVRVRVTHERDSDQSPLAESLGVFELPVSGGAQ